MNESVCISEMSRFWLALSQVPGVGRARLNRLQMSYADASVLLAEPPGVLSDLGLPVDLADRIPWHAADREIERVAKFGATVLSRQDSGYPQALLSLNDAPGLLYIWGRVLPDEQARSVAIVGTRKASAAGLETTRRLSAELAAHGVTILSGLARGIDSAAHRGAMESKGRTIAVLAGGLSRVYPPENQSLCQSISESGAVLTEFAMQSDPFPGAFLRRNRWIAALSSVVVVVEAPVGSGALNTARHARELARRLMVAPGPMFAPNWTGSNRELRDGAAVVTEPEDVLKFLGMPSNAPGPARTQGELWPAAEQRIRDCLDPIPISLDELIERSGLTPAEVRAALISLELGGAIRRHPGPLYGSP